MSVPPAILLARQRLCVSCQCRCHAYLVGSLNLRDPRACCLHPGGARWCPYQPGEKIAPVAYTEEFVAKVSLRGCCGKKASRVS